MTGLPWLSAFVCKLLVQSLQAAIGLVWHFWRLTTAYTEPSDIRPVCILGCASFWITFRLQLRTVSSAICGSWAGSVCEFLVQCESLCLGFTYLARSVDSLRLGSECQHAFKQTCTGYGVTSNSDLFCFLWVSCFFVFLFFVSGLVFLCWF